MHELQQFIPRHWPHLEVHFNPIFLQEHDLPQDPSLQLQNTIFKISEGAISFVTVIGTRFPSLSCFHP